MDQQKYNNWGHACNAISGNCSLHTKENNMQEIITKHALQELH
jgi:hypothetical protein